MTLYAIIFYILAAIVLAATVLAVTSRNVMHAIIYVVISFFAMAPIFYLLGAPFLALLEIIIYAGAIMVLFLFVVMMLKITPSAIPVTALLWQWAPALGLSVVTGVIMIFLLWQARPSRPGWPWPGPLPKSSAILSSTAIGSPWKLPRCCSLSLWWGPTIWAAARARPGRSHDCPL